MGQGLTPILQASAALSSGVSSFAGGLMQSRAFEDRAEYQSRISEVNSQIAETQSKDAIRRGKDTVKQYRRSVKQIIGSQRAAYAAQGIQVDSDSALAVQESTAFVRDLDIITIKANAFREAYGYKIQALKENALSQFALISGDFQSSQSLLAGISGAGQGLIKGAEAAGAFQFNSTGNILPTGQRSPSSTPSFGRFRAPGNVSTRNERIF